MTIDIDNINGFVLEKTGVHFSKDDPMLVVFSALEYVTRTVIAEPVENEIKPVLVEQEKIKFELAAMRDDISSMRKELVGHLQTFVTNLEVATDRAEKDIEPIAVKGGRNHLAREIALSVRLAFQHDAEFRKLVMHEIGQAVAVSLKEHRLIKLPKTIEGANQLMTPMRLMRPIGFLECPVR